MLTDAGFGQASAQVAVLPARVAYLIAPGSRSGFRRAVQEACTRWAGATEIIVPVPSRGDLAPAWHQFVELGSVECAVNVDAPGRAAASAAESLKLPLVELRHIDRSGPSQWSLHPANVAAEPPISSAYVIATGDAAPLWEVAAAGDLTVEHTTDVSSIGVVRRPRTADEIGRAQLFKTTLLDRTAAQFGEHHATNGAFPSPAVLWVTQPNSLKDCIWYWNCRALRSLTFAPFPMVLLPSSGLDGWTGFDAQLGGTLARSEDIEPDVLVCSLSVNDARLGAMARKLGLKQSKTKVRTGRRTPPPGPRAMPFTFQLNVDPRAFVTFSRRYGRTAETILHIATARTTLSIGSPVRFTGAGYTLLRIFSPALDHLPRRVCLAESVLPNADWSGDALQIRTSARPNYRLDLAIPGLEDATWTLVRSAAPDVRLSDKGRLAHRLEDVSSTPIVLAPGVAEVVRELTTPRSKELLRELARLRRAGHTDAELADLAAAWGGRAERRYRAAADLRAAVGPHASVAAEALATESWVERGLEVRCDQCSLRSFVPLRDVESRSTCPACRADQAYESSPDLRINYRLNALVDRASDQGVIAHVIAAAALRRRDPSTHLLMGVELTRRSGAATEVDLFGVHAGRVVAGEAKSSPAEFDEVQLARDVQNSVELGADQHLLVSLASIDPATVETARVLTERAGLGLLIIEHGNVRDGH